MYKKVEELEPSEVLSDAIQEQASRDIVIEAYHTPTHVRGGQSHYEKARTVKHVRRARKYVYLTMATYGIVRVEKGVRVCVVAAAANTPQRGSGGVS